MYIPRYWARSSSLPAGPNRSLLLQTWGWSDLSDADALERAERRLHALAQRVSSARDLARAWSYYSSGDRPLREEILDARPAGADGGAAIITRNRFGAAVLNTARIMFIDIDLPVDAPQRRSVFNWLRKRAPAETPDARLDRLKRDLGANCSASFRLYRTAGGFRAVAIDREFDPAGDEAQRAMTGVGADPMFIKLCVAQKSFRARLTPKPWRCGAPNPQHPYPCSTPDEERAAADWLAAYKRRADAFATCRYLETLGSDRRSGHLQALVELHDRWTRADAALPLA
jgi:hypothetical protein